MKQLDPKLSIGLHISLNIVLEFEICLAVGKVSISLKECLVTQHVFNYALPLEMLNDAAYLEFLHD